MFEIQTSKDHVNNCDHPPSIAARSSVNVYAFSSFPKQMQAFQFDLTGRKPKAYPPVYSFMSDSSAIDQERGK